MISPPLFKINPYIESKMNPLDSLLLSFLLTKGDHYGSRKKDN